MTYSDILDKLRKVYFEYPEYHEIGFFNMVELFSKDDFYILHEEAKQVMTIPEYITLY